MAVANSFPYNKQGVSGKIKKANVLNKMSVLSTLPIEFKSTWKTDNLSSDSTANNKIKLPLLITGTYNFTVNWGDGNTDLITSWNQSQVTHTYGTIGTYEISITGTCNGWSFNNDGDILKLLSILSWGVLIPKSELNGGQFYGCSNLNLNAVSDVLNLTGITNFTSFFNDCSSITTVNFIDDWNVSGITNMALMFSGCSNFNQSLNSWDVSNVTEMYYMFIYCSLFNGNISNWNTVNVISMNAMFGGCSNFNQSLNSWDIGIVTDMGSMFALCANFNQPLNDWDVSSVYNMQAMFSGCSNFNQPLNDWIVSNVGIMANMFQNATNFNQDLFSWNVSNVESMSNMFFGATAFNYKLSNWDVSKVADFLNFMGDKTPATYSAINLAETYNAWSALTLTGSLNISFGSAKYDSSGSSGRLILTTFPNFWTITDGGVL